MMGRWFVLTCVAAGLLGCGGSQPPPAPPAPPPPPPPPPVIAKSADASELAFLPESTIQLAVIRPAKILSQLTLSPEAKTLLAELKEKSSLDVEQIEEMAVVGVQVGDPKVLVQGFVLRSATPLDPVKVLEWLGNPPSEEKAGDKTVHVREGENPLSVHFADEKTVVFGNKDAVLPMIAADAKPSTEFAKLAENQAGAFDISIAMDLLPVRDTISDTISATRKELTLVGHMLRASDQMTLAINLKDRFEGDVFFKCKDERATEGVAGIADSVKKLLGIALSEPAKDPDPAVSSTAKFVQELIKGMAVHSDKPQREVRVVFRDPDGKIIEKLTEAFPAIQQQMLAPKPVRNKSNDKKADDADSDEPKADEPKTEEPKADEPKTDS